MPGNAARTTCTRTCTRALGWALPFTALLLMCWPELTMAEAYPRTTAVQARAMAPWGAWWLGMSFIALVVYPLLLQVALLQWRPQARASAWRVLGIGLLQWLTGAAMIVAMFVASIAHSTLSPLAFVLAWLGWLAASSWLGIRRAQ